jgi:hypothetical protein
MRAGSAICTYMHVSRSRCLCCTGATNMFCCVFLRAYMVVLYLHTQVVAIVCALGELWRRRAARHTARAFPRYIPKHLHRHNRVHKSSSSLSLSALSLIGAYRFPQRLAGAAQRSRCARARTLCAVYTRCMGVPPPSLRALSRAQTPGVLSLAVVARDRTISPACHKIRACGRGQAQQATCRRHSRVCDSQLSLSIWPPRQISHSLARAHQLRAASSRLVLARACAKLIDIWRGAHCAGWLAGSRPSLYRYVHPAATPNEQAANGSLVR